MGILFNRSVVLIVLALSLAACGATTAATIPAPKITPVSRPASTTSTSTTSMPMTTATIPARGATVQSPMVHGPVVLNGNGIGTAHFGEPEAAATTVLEKVLGQPTAATPTPSNNCTVDAFLQFPGIVIYFDRGTFVGYATGSANGENKEVLNVVTAKGLKIRDTLAQAQQLYGSEITMSVAQGGSWFIKTSNGKLAGYLTAEVNQPSAIPRIADITSGSVGCPAASP